MSNFYYITSENEAKKAVSWLSKQPTVAVDTETTGLSPFVDKVLLLQLGTEDKQFIFNLSKIDTTIFKNLLENPNILKIGQNFNFDYKMLCQNCDIAVTRMFDTMLAEQLITAGEVSRESNLEFLAKKYLNIDLDKSVRMSFLDSNAETDFSSVQLEYAAQDIAILFPIKVKQTELLKQYGLINVAKLEFDLIAPVAAMELAGIKLDGTKWKNFLRTIKGEVMKIKGELLPLLPQPDPPEPPAIKMTKDGNPFAKPPKIVYKFVNLDSPIQMADILENKLKINLAKYEKQTNAGKTNTTTLKKAAGDPKLNPKQKKVLDLLLQYREVRQITKNFGDNLINLINPITGRVHGSFHQLGAASGRFSSSNPNMQNIPKRKKSSSMLRGCFVAEPGNKIIKGDYSQIEIRILAELSNDAVLINALTTGGDIHKSTAALMFAVDMDNLKTTNPAQYDKYRDAAKSINFGVIYGMSSNKLSQMLQISVQDADKLMQKYRNVYFNSLGWLDQVGDKVLQDKYSRDMLGRIRWFSMGEDVSARDINKIGSHMRRAGRNHVIQGTSASMTKTAIIYIYNAIKPYQAKLVNTVHDEIVVEAAEDVADKIEEIMQMCMKKAGETFLKKVPVLVETKVSDSWA